MFFYSTVQLTYSILSLNPTAPSFPSYNLLSSGTRTTLSITTIPSQSHQSPPTNSFLQPNRDPPQYKPTGPAKKRAKTNPVRTSDDTAQVEALTTELSYAQTRIVSQDVKIRDLEQKVKILTDKNRIAEEKLANDLHSKYFDHPSTCSPPNRATCSCAPCCTSHQCPAYPRYSQNSYCHISKNVSQELSTHRADLAIIKADIDTLKSLKVTEKETPLQASSGRSSSENILLSQKPSADRIASADISNASLDEFVPVTENYEFSPMQDSAITFQNILSVLNLLQIF